MFITAKRKGTDPWSARFIVFSADQVGVYTRVHVLLETEV